METFLKKAGLRGPCLFYQSLPGVIDSQPVSIHPVYAVPNDQFYYLQWHLPKIQPPQAWDMQMGNASIVVAILDTGVRYFMQDLGGSATSYSAPTQAFAYAANNGAKIASCSWGSENTGGIQEAIDYFLASGGLII